LARLAEKAVLVGIDSITPELSLKFIEEGILPNWRKLVENGVYAEGIPPLPALTGCWFHLLGRPLDELVNGFLYPLTEAECLWTTAERYGLRPLIMKYAGALGYAKNPFAVSEGMQVEGFASPLWGGNWFEICPSMLYTTLDYSSAERIELRRASGWKNLPNTGLEPVESVIVTKAKRGDANVSFHMLLLNSRGEGYDHVALSPSKDYEKAFTIAVGNWSPWSEVEFKGNVLQGPPVTAKQVPNGGFRWGYSEEYTRELKGVRATLRFKLIELSPDGKRLRLYRSQVFPAKGFTHPEGLAEELLGKVGPFQEHIGPLPIYNGWIDEETFLEEMEYQASWLGRSSAYIMSRYKWDLYFLQWHGPNHAQHTFWGGIDPSTPWYRPSEAKKYWDIFRRFYGTADEMTGEIVKNAGDRAVIVVVADHGHCPIARGTVFLGNVLVKAGLLKLERDGKGRLTVDWSRTKAIPLGQDYVYVNLKDRDPNGIIEPGQEYEAVREEIINALFGIRDPDGRCPISFAFRREDGENLGVYGERVGDVIYQLAGGYEGSVFSFTDDLEPFPEGRYGETLSDDSRGGQGLTRGPSSEHGYHFPTTRFGLGSIRVPFIISGLGIAKGRRLTKPIRLVDIAPTLAYLLGIPPPAQCEGRVMREVLA